MSTHQKTLSIGDIGILIESDREFFLSKRCLAFQKELDRVDVTVHLSQGYRDCSGCPLVHAGSNFDIVQTPKGLVTLRYANERKDDLIWYMWTVSPGTYRVMFAETLLWAYESVNPLFFFDLADFLAAFNAIILHSAVIVHRGKAIAFTAPSQTGKSTQADLWHTYKQARILNGDRGLIRRQEEGYRIYGSPYAGSSGIYLNESAPLEAIVVLKQAPYNKVSRIGGKQAYLHLLSQTSMSVWNKETIEKQSTWLLEMIAAVPVYLLECLPDQDAVETLYRELKG